MVGIEAGSGEIERESLFLLTHPVEKVSRSELRSQHPGLIRGGAAPERRRGLGIPGREAGGEQFGAESPAIRQVRSGLEEEPHRFLEFPLFGPGEGKAARGMGNPGFAAIAAPSWAMPSSARSLWRRTRAS